MANTRSLIAILAISALVAGPLPSFLPIGDIDGAYAKGNGGNGGGGNGGGNGGGKGGGGKGGGKAGGNGHAKTGGGTSAKKAAAVGAAATLVTETVAEPPPATEPPPEIVTELPDEQVTGEEVAELEPDLPNKHGKIASELKGLNAYHASETAFQNAAPNSQVGRIAAYREAALQTRTADEDLTAAEESLGLAQADLQALDESYDGRPAADIDADIAGLDPAAADYQSQYDALNAERAAAAEYEAARAELAAAAADAELGVVDAETTAAGAAATEEEALASAAKGRTLSPEALDYLRDQLGL
jgi:hypothetical protein